MFLKSFKSIYPGIKAEKEHEGFKKDIEGFKKEGLSHAQTKEPALPDKNGKILELKTKKITANRKTKLCEYIGAGSKFYILLQS